MFWLRNQFANHCPVNQMLASFARNYQSGSYNRNLGNFETVSEKSPKNVLKLPSPTSAERNLRGETYWITPIFPFKNPPSALPAKAIHIFDANPTIIMLNIVPAHPTSSTGFRPILSDSPPQKKPVSDSASAKALIRMPA
jgi:hypothetical protein